MLSNNVGAGLQPGEPVPRDKPANPGRAGLSWASKGILPAPRPSTDQHNLQAPENIPSINQL